MTYSKLKFSQYFIDSSRDQNNTGNASREVIYNHIEYNSHFKHIHSAEYEVYLDNKRQVIQINFDRTRGVGDVLDDLNFLPMQYPRKKGIYFHRGWLTMYEVLRPTLIKQFQEYYQKHKKYTIEIVGWSLGSALAQICAVDLYTSLGIKSYVYTFGSVKTFFLKKSVEYAKECVISSYNFCINNDPITLLPCFPGWYMINKITVKFDKFSIFKILNGNYYHCSYDKDTIYKGIE